MMDAGFGSSFRISFVLVVHVHGGVFGVTNSVTENTSVGEPRKTMWQSTFRLP